MLRFATSGAMVLSDPSRLGDILWPDVDAVEVGNLAAPAAVVGLVAAAAGAGLGWNLHTPLLGGGPKRLLWEPSPAWDDRLAQVEAELRTAKRLGAGYALLHAPWLPDQGLPVGRARDLCNATLRGLGELGIDLPIVAELKLGHQGDPGLLGHIVRRPDFLEPGDIRYCLDVGDWILACEALGADPVAAYAPLASHTRVVHVHGVFRGEPYLWTPIHPDDPDAPRVLALVELLLERTDALTVVFEHTPHRDPGSAYHRAGAAWFMRMVRGSLDKPDGRRAAGSRVP